MQTSGAGREQSSKPERLELDFPRHDVLEHHPVAHETPDGVLECDGLVLLYEIVSRPGDSVSENGGQEEDREAFGENSGQYYYKHDDTSREMQSSIQGVGVFGKVVLVKLTKAAELSILYIRHDQFPRLFFC